MEQSQLPWAKSWLRKNMLSSRSWDRRVLSSLLRLVICSARLSRSCVHFFFFWRHLDAVHPLGYVPFYIERKKERITQLTSYAVPFQEPFALIIVFFVFGGIRRTTLASGGMDRFWWRGFDGTKGGGFDDFGTRIYGGGRRSGWPLLHCVGVEKEHGIRCCLLYWCRMTIVVVVAELTCDGAGRSQGRRAS